MYGILYIIYRLLNLYSWVVLAYCILSFFPAMDRSTVNNVLRIMCEPVLSPIRNFLMRRTRMTMFDLSPIVVYLLIGLLQRVVIWLMTIM